MTTPIRFRVPAQFPGNYGKLREERVGIMLHYDASASDDGAVQWLLFDLNCKVSYNWLALDDGTLRNIAPHDARAWHAGGCRSSDPARFPYQDANSAFYGIAIAARPGDRVTLEQLRIVVDLCAALCDRHGWNELQITTHRAEAWPRGRKPDPDLPSPAVMTLEEVQNGVRELLAGMAA